MTDRRPAAELDLTGVAPHRRAEVRRRVAVVLDYLDLPAPTIDDDLTHAARLGLTPQSFLLLVRAWRDHGRASEMPGARSGSRRTRPRIVRLDAAVETIVAKAVAQAGPGARPVDVAAIIGERCAESDLPAPTFATIAGRLYAARSDAPPDADHPAMLVVDHSALRLAVRVSGALQVPVLTVAFSLPSRRVLAHALRPTPPGPQVAAEVLARALDVRPSPKGGHAPLFMASDFTPDWTAVLDAIAGAGVARSGPRAAPPPSSRRLRSAFGQGISAIRFLPLLTHRPMASRGPAVTGIGRPLEWDEAVAAVDDAVAEHNAAVGDPSRPVLADREAEGALAARLSAIAARPPEAPRRRRGR